MAQDSRDLRGVSLFALCGLRRHPPFQADQAFDVVDEVGESDLGRRSGHADGPDEQAHPGLLLGEDMLDVGAYLEFEVVGPARRRSSACPWAFCGGPD